MNDPIDGMSPRRSFVTDHDERMSLHPGTLIDNRYLVERLLGIGGMGTVVAARVIETGELVAIKSMLPHCAQERQLVVRFQREAKATERIRSEHVLRVLGSGEVATGPYLVMEYLDGEDLKSLVKREGPLEPRQAATYVSQVCDALAEAHALGIVHRDLKPANLFLARRPGAPSIIKVLDFGVARFSSPNIAGDEHDVTATGHVLGTRHYMAPEQILSPKDVTPLADVWALGAILHFLLTGKTPFAAPTLEEVIVNVLREPPHPIELWRGDVPERLLAIVKQCLEKRPEDRFSNVTEVARALASFVRQKDPEGPADSVPAYLATTLRISDNPIRMPSEPPTSAAAEREDKTHVRPQKTSIRPRPRSVTTTVLASLAASVTGALLALASQTILASARPRAMYLGPSPMLEARLDVSIAPPAAAPPPSVAHAREEGAPSASIVKPAVLTTVAPSAAKPPPPARAKLKRDTELVSPWGYD